MSLALSIITEGNNPHLKKAVKSVYKYVDHIFITTTKVNKPQWDESKITWSFFPWHDDFSAARNHNLSTIPMSFTHFLWIDTDDIVINPEMIPYVVGQMVERGLDAVYVDYNYDIDKNGQVLIVHPRERIVRRDIYFWKGKLHETLIPTKKVQSAYIKDFVVNHYPNKENKAGGLQRNFKIIFKDYEEQRKELLAGKRDEIDPRSEYYLGRVLFDMHTKASYQKAVGLFQDYLQHSGWDEERAYAWNYLGQIYYLFGEYDEAVNAYLSAIKERPEFPSWHINLARTYCALKKFSKAEHHVKVGTTMKQPNTSMILTPFEDKVNALTSLFFIYFDKKDFKRAIRMANMLYDLKPCKENLKRIESIEKLQKWTNWMKAVTGMVSELYNKGKIDKLEGLLACLPEEVAKTAYTDVLKMNYGRAKAWPKNSIVYYAATDLQSWTPKDLKTGIGGSEEAIIYLSKLWTKLGYQVTVYTNVGADEGIYDGVTYLNFQRFNHRDKFDILISWRNPNFFSKNIFDARLTLLDLHDIPEVGEFDQTLLQRADYIMVKSPYHRTLLPDVSDNKFKVISNGIDSEILKTIKGEHKSHAMFYGSSPDRGLQNLLNIWDDVRKAVPNAELHVCYGFELFDKIYSHVPHKMAWKKRMMDLMKQPGIIYHGKVGKQELYEIAKSCALWAYPTDFQEIDCLTARYCQALGTVPVVYNYAALTTSVQRGVRLAVDPFKPESLVLYKKELIKTLKVIPKFPDMIENALNNFGWDKVAEKWLKVFQEEKKQDIKVTVFTPTIRTGWWNIMAYNLSQQTYKNFEWLIVDDYKEDRQKIADKYAKKYGLNIRYMRGKLPRSKYNYALIQADNMAVFNATGELIVWLQDFILIPPFALERLVNIYRRYPNAVIAPVDAYHQMIKPNRKNKEDWFDGKTKVIGKFIRKNIRIKQECLRASNNPYDLELNFGAVPTKVVRKLNGFWEFQDDGLGYNNTDIAFRALKAGCQMLIDERLKAVCLDLWEHLAGTDENAKNREWNLNDSRFQFIMDMTNLHKLPIIRDSNLDRKIKLTYKMPKGIDQKGAAKWMQKNYRKIAIAWERKFNEKK